MEVINTKDSLLTFLSMAKVCKSFKMVIVMKVTFFLINELAKVSIYGQAAKAMKVILSTVSWMAGEYTPGLTVHIMKENLSTMNEGTVFMSGRWMIRRKEKLKTINLAAGLFFSGQKRIVN